MKNTKRILLFTVTVFSLMAVNFTNAMDESDQSHKRKIDQAFDNFGVNLMGIATGFYGNMAQVAVDALRDDAKAERDIKVANANAKNEALKFGVAAREVMKSLTN